MHQPMRREMQVPQIAAEKSAVLYGLRLVNAKNYFPTLA
jgi:hypothetical protein